MNVVTVTQNPNGTFRYAVDGAVFLKGSRRFYTHAALYRGEDGTVYASPHARADLAAKGNPHYNLAAKFGMTEIVNLDEAPALALVAEDTDQDGPTHDPARCSVAGCTLGATA